MKKKSRVNGIEGYCHGHGDHIGILLDQPITKQDLARGQVLSSVGTIEEYTEFDAVVWVLGASDMNNREPTTINPGGEFDFYFRTVDIGGVVVCDKPITPASSGTVRVVLNQSVALEEHQRFAIRLNGRTVAAGCIFQLYV